MEPDDDTEMPEVDGEEPPAPRNKAEFYKLFNQKGPTNMICGFMLEKSLKLSAHILVDISYPLENSYYRALERISQGWTEQEAFISGRSAGEWLVTVHEIMQVLEFDAFHNHLELSQCMRLERPPSPNNWPVWALGEETVLDEAYCFGVTLAENVLWSNIHHWLEFPSVVATVLHHDQEVVDMSFIHMTKLARAVNGAENVNSAKMKELLSDLGWNREQLARESMALILQLEIEELKKLARRLFRGTPSTKDCLENTFAFLHRKAQVHSTNNKMSDMVKYLYTILSPYAKTGGCPQILPSKSDMQTIHSPQGFATRVQAHRSLFSPQHSLFPCPKAVPKPGQLFFRKSNCFLESPTVFRKSNCFFVQTVWEMERCYACSSIIIMQDRFMLQGSKRPGSELSRLLLQQLHIFCRILNRTGPTLTFAGSVTFLLLIHHQLFWIVFSGYAILGVPIVFIQL
jgi:hypothetical protein